LGGGEEREKALHRREEMRSRDCGGRGGDAGIRSREYLRGKNGPNCYESEETPTDAKVGRKVVRKRTGYLRK